jgi:hypothetical protein
MPASRSVGSTAAAQADADAVAREPWDPRLRLSPEALVWNVEHWLIRLRPDPRDERQTKVWPVEFELPNAAMIDGGDIRVELWLGHPLVERLLQHPTPANLGWVLLAVYAHINAGSWLVSNDHEAQFHLIVGGAIANDALQVLVPTPADLF